ncbi:MAG TPA: hypothetical protein VLB50_04350 [Ignavibacteriaceae bacterium]|nr:hypothetical protein [Ignavibacteriaceae bacterium]
MLKYHFQRIVPTTRSKGKLLSIVFLLFFSCFLSNTIAQVTIKEKIELNGLPENNLKKNTSVASSLIMPSRGTLQIYYSYVNHFDYSLPDYSTLNSYFFRGDSSKVDSIMPRLTTPIINYETIWDYCYDQITYRQVYYYNSSNDTNVYKYNVGNVNQGDTVQFTYFSDNIETGDTITYGITDTVEYYQNGELVGWDVTFGWYDYCIQRYVNILQVFIGVMKDYELLVNIEPGILYPGDTASVVIKKLMLQDSSIVDFDSSQTFEVAKLEGCIWGDILAEDSLSAYFYGARQPIKFVVDTSAAVIDSLASDSGKVLISVGVIENNQKAKIHLQPNDITDCFTNILEIQDTTKSQAKIKNPLEIISPTAEDTNWISDVPNMPLIICNARMNGYFWGNVKYRWSFWVNSNLSRRNKNKAGHWYSLCPRISQSVFLGYSYATNNEITQWTVPFLVDSGYYYYKAIWYKTDTTFHQPANGCDSSYSQYEGGNVVFTGGDVSIKVTAYNIQGKKLGEDSISAGQILGKNQTDLNVIYNYANSNEIKAILQCESRTKQFETTPRFPKYEIGWPLYGYPNGYGLMQIDNRPAAVEEQLWNWKANINGGIVHFDSAKAYSERYMKNAIKNGAIRTDSIYYMNAFQNYNGGRYWDWKGKEQGWQENTQKLADNHYGRNVYLVYIGLH